MGTLKNAFRGTPSHFFSFLFFLLVEGSYLLFELPRVRKEKSSYAYTRT